MSPAWGKISRKSFTGFNQFYIMSILEKQKLKTFSVFLFGLFCFHCSAQVQPLLYGGANYIRDKSFNENYYFNFSFGGEIFRWKFIAPELGYELYYGKAKDFNELNPEEPNARALSKLSSKFAAHTFSVAPKIVIGDREAALVFIPQYNIGAIRVGADLLKDVGKNYNLSERQVINKSTTFWSFALGIEGDFLESDLIHFSLLIKYHLLNSKDVFQQVDFETSDLNLIAGSKDGIGLAFRAYFNLF